MKLPLFSILTGCFMVVVSGCSQPKEKNSEPRRVKVVVPETTGEISVRQFNGVLEEASKSDLAFRVGGPLSEIFVDEGDYVKAGEKLASIDSRDYNLNLRMAEAQYNQSKAEYERYQELFKQDKLPANTFEKFKTAWLAAQSNYEKAKNALEDTRLTAPFAGCIFQKHISQRETIAPGAPAFTLISDALEVKFGVSETLVTRIKVKTKATVFAGNISIPATVKSVSTKSGSDNLYEVRLSVISQNIEMIRPGMSAKVSLNISKQENTTNLTLPVEAIFHKQHAPQVWIFNSVAGNVTMRTVSTGELRTGGRIEILTGLTGDEKIVSAGVHSLHQEQMVKILPLKH